jgi:hypothetical protein
MCLLTCLACGSGLPARYVIEHDLSDFAYRRYQKTLDVDVPIRGNPAVGHTATYVRRDQGRVVAFTTAFVTSYERAPSLAAEVRERLKALESYRFSVGDLGGGYVWLLDGGPEERWALWVSGRYLVKIGAPTGEDVPDAVVAAYMDVYPSDLDEYGRAQSDAPSAGPSRTQKDEREAEEQELPRHLREGAPR